MSLQLWYSHEAFEALVCGTLQWISYLTSTLLERPCNEIWWLSRSTAAVAARLWQLHVRRHRVHAEIAFVVQVFDCYACFVLYANCYSKESS